MARFVSKSKMMAAWSLMCFALMTLSQWNFQSCFKMAGNSLWDKRLQARWLRTALCSSVADQQTKSALDLECSSAQEEAHILSYFMASFKGDKFSNWFTQPSVYIWQYKDSLSDLRCVHSL